MLYHYEDHMNWTLHWTSLFTLQIFKEVILFVNNVRSNCPSYKTIKYPHQFSSRVLLFNIFWLNTQICFNCKSDVVDEFNIYNIFTPQYSWNAWGPSWLWSYGSWIYNNLCNRRLLPLKLWLWNSFMVRWTWYIYVHSSSVLLFNIFWLNTQVCFISKGLVVDQFNIYYICIVLLHPTI